MFYNAPQLHNLPLFGLLSVSMIKFIGLLLKNANMGQISNHTAIFFSVLLTKPIRGHGERNPHQDFVKIQFLYNTSGSCSKKWNAFRCVGLGKIPNKLPCKNIENSFSCYMVELALNKNNIFEC